MYVMHNPVMFIDPSGLSATTSREGNYNVTRITNRDGSVDIQLHCWRSGDWAGSFASTGWSSIAPGGEDRPHLNTSTVNSILGLDHISAFVGSFQVFDSFSSRHSAIVVMVGPRSSYWLNDSRFANSLFSGSIRFATLGGQPQFKPIVEDGVSGFGRLIGHVNYSGDVRIVTSGSPLMRLNASPSQISSMLRNEQFFRDNNHNAPQYRLFPERTPLYGFNSNSYVRSLLRHSGIDAPTLPGNFPGWNQMMPRIYFGVR